MRFLVPFFVAALWVCCWIMPANAQGISFDDSDPDLIILDNGADYAIGFRKSNGSIAYITDKATDQHVSLGSRHECLWGAVFPSGMPDYVGGCNFNAAEPNHFGYTWSSAANTLTLNYTPEPTSLQQVTAKIDVTVSEEPWFDMRMELQNDWGSVLDYILFPSDLVFVEADIEEALLPILPGVVFEPAFFEQNRSYTGKYPGYPGFFADYVSISSQKGQIALYSLYEQGPIRPLVLGFIHDEEYVADSTYYYHTFGAGIGDGETWTTPWVRIRVSQSPLETIAAYRADNGLDQFLSLEEKLGANQSRIFQSPLFKADAVQLAIPFSQYADVLSGAPTPGILHPVAFQPGGHDESYPDFLPPDLAWGTTEDFARMLEDARALGLLVMPYTNPTWWDDESPTLQNLPPATAISDVAVLDDQGLPIYEAYGPHWGYVMSPHSPFVQERLEQLVISMTVDIPSDILFEDQIGARPWLFDHNPSSPGPTAYIDGWLAHTHTYSNTLLMTELAFDRLVESEAGFHGSVLLPERLGYTPDWWGTDTWHPYPLAPLMARDKVLFYQHDLAPETFTTDKATLTWNLAYGYMLSYDLVESAFGGGLESDWLDLVALFQKNVIARYAREVVTDFEYLTDNVTRTSFETYTVTANWDGATPYNTEKHTLPPMGVQVTEADGALTAGVFTRFNGGNLSVGDHYLVEDRGVNEITVYQPVGADTPLTLEPLADWRPSCRVEVRAYNENGSIVGSELIEVTGQGITFVYQQVVDGQPVAYYKVHKPRGIFLPLAR